MTARKILFTSIFSFLVVGTSVCFGQKQVSGVITEEISLSDGTLKISRTEHLPKGKTISGSIFRETESDKAKKKEKQFENLSQLLLKIGEDIVPAVGKFIVELPQDETIPFKIIDSGGKILFEILLELEEPLTISTTHIPQTIRANRLERIIGSFSGDVSKANVLIDDLPLKIVAGNEAEISFQTGDITTGEHVLTLDYGDTFISENVTVTDYTLDAGKLSLERGESTRLDATVTGLENLKETLFFEITNASPATIGLEGGNAQVMEIKPESVSDNGTWQKSWEIESLMRGGFDIITNLKTPSDTLKLLNLTDRKSLKTHEADHYISPSRYSNLSLNSSTFESGQKLISVLTYNHDFIPSIVRFDVYDLESGTIYFSELDTTPEMGAEFSAVLNMEPGIYALQALAYYGANQTSITTALFYQSGNTFTSITNSKIGGIENDIEDAQDELERLKKEYDRLQKEKYEKEDTADEEEYESWEDEKKAEALTRIDEVLDEVEGWFADELKDLLDTLVNHPPVPDTAKLRSYVRDLEKELDDCTKALEELEKEKEELEKKIPQIEAQQMAAFQQIKDAFRSTGYNWSARQSRGEDGSFNYSYSTILGTTIYKGGVPAEISSEISQLDNELEELENQRTQASARLGELPGLIQDKQKECDELNDLLNKAKQALEEGKNLADNFSAMQLKREHICLRIKYISQRLIKWCENNPGLCDFQEELTKLVVNCPKDTLEAQKFWESFNEILSAKKQMESDFAESAEKHKGNADDLREDAEELDDKMDDTWDEIRKLGDKISQLEREKAQAIKDEKARRAKLAQQKKTACEKILKENGIEPEDASVIKDLEKIKDEIQEIGGMVSKASKLGGKIPNKKIKEMADKLGKSIDEILKPLEKYDELKEKAEELLEIKDKLETLMSEGDSPSERAEKFGAYLELINTILSEVGDKFPILKFFTAYFDYLVQGYLAAIDGAQKAFTNQYEEIIESALNDISCESLLQEYMKNNSLDDMYEKACRECGSAHYGQNDWQKEAFEKIVRKQALKKIIDCCLDRLS